MKMRMFGSALVCALITSVSVAQNNDAPRRVREWRKAWSNLTPEQRGSLTEAWKTSIEALENLSPEQKAKMREAASDLGDFLANLTPEQRENARELFQKMRAAFRPLTLEQKQQLLANLSDNVDRLESLTPEQKQKLRDSWQRWLEQHRRRRGESGQEPDEKQSGGEKTPEAPESSASRVRTLKPGGGRLDWSSENDLIAFDIKGDDDYFEVHTMKRDGSNDRCVSCGVPGLPQRHVGQPAWHPSGRYLVVQVEKREHVKIRAKFALNPGAGVLNDLWLIDLKENRSYPLREVENEPGRGTLHPHFSVDGKKLSWSEMYGKAGFNKSQELGYWKLMVADFVLNGAAPRLENIRSFTPGGDGFRENHGFSPDGQKLIYTSNANSGRFDNDICVLDLESGRETKLTNGGHNEHAIFSPDGNHIVWMSNKDNSNKGTDYWIMNANGTGKKRVTFFNQKGHPDYVGRRVLVADFTWNPDGTSIAAYTRMGSGVVPKKEDSKIVTVDLSAELGANK